jgi:hypothetical protein
MKLKGQNAGYLAGVRNLDFNIVYPDDILESQKILFDEGYNIGYKLGKDWFNTYKKKRSVKHKLF